jgi:hypothetical protein
MGTGDLSLGVKRPGREADHSPPSTAEVQNAWSYTSIHPIYIYIYIYISSWRGAYFSTVITLRFYLLHRLRVFENREMRKIFGPKREEDGTWRKLHNDELHSLYSSPNIVRLIKSRRMRWAGRVARMERGRCLQGFGWEVRR